MHRSPAKGLSTMEKKVPKSEKYAHIQGKLDTGLNINKVKVVTAREFAKRRDEIFFRVTKGQLFELLHEYEADEQERITDNEVYGQGPRIVTYSELAEPDYNRPYLILDVREASSYNTCHILQSRNFPFALLRRDQMHPEIFKFKNKEEHLIILYCDDERISRDAASTLVDRGIDNVFLLNGGLKEFAGSYSMYVEGDIPLEWLPVKSNQSRSKLSAIPEDRRANNDCSLSAAALSRHNGGMKPSPNKSVRSREDRSETAATTMSNRSVAETVISKSVSRKGRF